MNNRIRNLKEELSKAKEELEKYKFEEISNKIKLQVGSIFKNKKHPWEKYIVVLGCNKSYGSLYLEYLNIDFIREPYFKDIKVSGISVDEEEISQPLEEIFKDYVKVSEKLEDIINRYFELLNKNIDELILIHKSSFGSSGLLRDDLVGRYFKIDQKSFLGGRTIGSHIYKIGDTDTKDERPTGYSGICLEFYQNERTTCRSLDNVVSRAELLDPDFSTEISEELYTKYINEAKNQFIKIIKEYEQTK